MTRLCVIFTLLVFLSQKFVYSDVLLKNQTCPTISSSFYNVEWPSTANLTLSNPPCINQNKELLYRKCLNGVWGLEPECEYIKKIIPPKCPFCYILNSFNTNLEVIRHERDQVEFVAILQLGYPYEDFYEFIQNEIFKKLSAINYLKQFYTFTVMKIIHRDETKREVLVNIHLTSRKLNSSYEDEFQKVERLLKISQVEMVNFLSTQYCMSETKIIFWPTTPVGSESVSTQYCFKPNGAPLTRMCEGNGIDGAQWADIDETCEIPRRSSVTQKLLELMETVEPTSLSNFSYFYHINPFDVFLFGKILQKTLAHISDTNHFVDIYFRIICSLLDVDRDIWIEAQYKMKATDIILDAINSFFQKYNGTKNLCKKDYLYIQSVPITQLGGFAIIKDHDPCDDGIVIFSSGKVSKRQNFVECFIQLFPEFIWQLGNNTNAVLFIFFKDSLFSEKSFFTETYLHSKVMRVMFQNFTDSQRLDRAIFFSQNVDTISSTNCSSWSYSNEKHGSWENVEGGDRTNSTQVCQLVHTFYFALTETIEKNVTEILSEILEANITVPETIRNLQNVSRRYQEFVPLDVFLVGKILKKVHEDKEIDLEALTETVSNLHLIQKNVLQESQVKKKATDSILHFLDKILINHNYKSRVQTVADNFMILIYDTKETNFSGVVLLKENNTIQMQILEGDIDVEEISSFKNLESALVFSSKLKEQLEEDAKIIVTLFASDVLFNEQEKSSKNVSRIFGVIFPEIQNYSGPISMLQKIPQNNSLKQCAHWKYNQTFSGIWLKDQDGKELSSLIECDFWHTTHFALLLLDENKYPNQIVLDWITYLNCILSLFGLFCIFLTAIFFKKWRQNSGNKILLNFAFAITLQIILFHISSVVDRNSDDFLLCTVIGMILHYSVISEFCWMVVIAYLQFKRFVQVLGGPPQHILLKGCLLGWLFPLLPVIFVLLFGGYNSVSNNVGLCYPSGLGLFLGVWLPVSVAILINFAMFGSIIYSVCHKKTECGGVVGKESIFQWKLAFLLFFMLGMSWIFGFLSELNFGIVFVYLFSITATLQGFVVFWFFIVLNSSTKNMYWHNVKKYCRKDY